MQFLIISRHGDYDDGGQLSSLGRQQIENLIKKIELFSEGRSMLILSSSANHAVQSAQIIADYFSAKLEIHKILWSGNDSGQIEDYDGIIRLIKEKEDEADIIFLETHYEIVDNLPERFMSSIGIFSIPNITINKGQACVIDYEYGTIKKL